MSRLDFSIDLLVILVMYFLFCFFVGFFVFYIYKRWNLENTFMSAYGEDLILFNAQYHVLRKASDDLMLKFCNIN